MQPLLYQTLNIPAQPQLEDRCSQGSAAQLQREKSQEVCMVPGLDKLRRLHMLGTHTGNT